jgi:hypothetical protein
MEERDSCVLGNNEERSIVWGVRKVGGTIKLVLNATAWSELFAFPATILDFSVSEINYFERQ